MILREITATLPDGTTMKFGSRDEAGRTLGIGQQAVRRMIDLGLAYEARNSRGKKELIGMTMSERAWVAQSQAISTKTMCLKCCHIFTFEAKDGDRYVCCLYGKRITEEPLECKGYKKGIERRWHEYR